MLSNCYSKDVIFMTIKLKYIPGNYVNNYCTSKYSAENTHVWIINHNFQLRVQIEVPRYDAIISNQY